MIFLIYSRPDSGRGLAGNQKIQKAAVLWLPRNFETSHLEFVVSVKKRHQGFQCFESTKYLNAIFEMLRFQIICEKSQLILKIVLKSWRVICFECFQTYLCYDQKYSFCHVKQSSTTGLIFRIYLILLSTTLSIQIGCNLNLI